MLSFIEENCLVFDPEDENKFEYTKIHKVNSAPFHRQDYKKLFETLFEELIKDLGITEEQFVEACEQANKNDENKKIINQLLSVDDFMAFKHLMLQRNKELNDQATKLVCFLPK